MDFECIQYISFFSWFMMTLCDWLSAHYIFKQRVTWHPILSLSWGIWCIPYAKYAHHFTQISLNLQTKSCSDKGLEFRVHILKNKIKNITIFELNDSQKILYVIRKIQHVISMTDWLRDLVRPAKPREKGEACDVCLRRLKKPKRKNCTDVTLKFSRSTSHKKKKNCLRVPD